MHCAVTDTAQDKTLPQNNRLVDIFAVTAAFSIRIFHWEKFILNDGAPKGCYIYNARMIVRSLNRRLAAILLFVHLADR